MRHFRGLPYLGRGSQRKRFSNTPSIDPRKPAGAVVIIKMSHAGSAQGDVEAAGRGVLHGKPGELVRGQRRSVDRSGGPSGSGLIEAPDTAALQARPERASGDEDSRGRSEGDGADTIAVEHVLRRVGSGWCVGVGIGRQSIPGSSPIQR